MEHKKRIKKVFEKTPKFELVEMPFIDVDEDPVRPELSLEFRQAYGRKIYGIKDEDGDIAAVMCFAFTHGIPTSVEEMDKLSKDAAMQAVHRAGVQGQDSDSIHSVGQEERWRKAHGERSVQDDQEFQSFEQTSNTESANRHGKEVPLEERSKRNTS